MAKVVKCRRLQRRSLIDFKTFYALSLVIFKNEGISIHESINKLRMAKI